VAISLDSKPEGRFANLLYDMMDKKDLSIRDVAEATDATYEHIRKMLKGIAFPSKLMLKALAKILGVSYDVFDEALTHDRMEHKYGKMAHKVMGQSPETARFSPLLPKLTEQQQDALYSMAQTFAKQNRDAEKK
jgi:transcriptional regulator with XRE-family HTH domain